MLFSSTGMKDKINVNENFQDKNFKLMLNCR